MSNRFPRLRELSIAELQDISRIKNAQGSVQNMVIEALEALARLDALPLDEPTDALPGSLEKMLVLERRLAEGKQLNHPEDRQGYEGITGWKDAGLNESDKRRGAGKRDYPTGRPPSRFTPQQEEDICRQYIVYSPRKTNIKALAHAYQCPIQAIHTVLRRGKRI